ncbi:MAG: glycerophosphodiester phosphodiesterase [Burkholderiaceae bacterium]|nr:glycerophosphodiester phosphodiesterase [Burkholderiaceae bacterium]
MRPFHAGYLAFLLAFSVATPLAAAFDLQGHRGARGLMPENTLPAFERALAIGVTTLELDTGITADGVVVVSHDPILNPDLVRGPDGQWLTAPTPIRSLTWAQLQTYDVGRLRPGSRYAQQFPQQQPIDVTRMPRLADVFARVKALGADAVQFDIETKIDPRRPDATLAPEPFVQALLAVIREHGMEERVMVQSFDWRTLQLLRAQAPKVRTVYLSVQRPQFNSIETEPGLWTAGQRLADHGSVPRMVKAAGGHVWSPNFNDLTPALLREAQSLGLKVIPWTVNEPADIARILDLPVDGIISDYPDRVRSEMTRRKLPLPPAVKL